MFKQFLKNQKIKFLKEQEKFKKDTKSYIVGRIIIGIIALFMVTPVIIAIFKISNIYYIFGSKKISIILIISLMIYYLEVLIKYVFYKFFYKREGEIKNEQSNINGKINKRSRSKIHTNK